MGTVTIRNGSRAGSRSRIQLLRYWQCVCCPAVRYASNSSHPDSVTITHLVHMNSNRSEGTTTSRSWSLLTISYFSHARGSSHQSQDGS